MKTKFIFTGVIVAIISMAMVQAQITPSIRIVSMGENDQAILDKHISKYVTFTFDKKLLADSLHSTGSGQFRLQIDENLDWTIDIELNDLRAPEFKATYVSDEGVFDFKEPFVVNTFKGKTSEGQTVRFTIDENTFFGVILGDTYHYVIRAVSDYTQNGDDISLIVYKSCDIISEGDGFDFINDALEVPEDGKIGLNGADLADSLNDTRASTSCSVNYLRVATDADYEFFQSKGINTNSFIVSVLNIADGVYESTFKLKILITFQNFYSTISQPYTSYDASNLLTSFRTLWDNTHTGVSRNIAHLFTGKTLNSGVLGISWKGAINGNSPGNYAYSVTKDDTNLQYTTVHEIGHNLNANDNPPGADCNCGLVSRSVMCQGNNITNIWFCSQSYNEINSFLNNNLALLTSICGPSSVCYEGCQFELVNASSGTITWTLSAGSTFSFNPPEQPALMQKTTLNVPHQVVVYRTSAGSSNGTLTATNSSGGAVTKTISPCLLYISGPSEVCYGGDQHTLNYPPPSGPTLYYWTVTGPFSFSSSSVVTSTTAYPPTVYKTTASSSYGTLSARIGSFSGPVVISRTMVPCVTSISGPPMFCYDSGSFTLINPPPGTIYWTVSDSSYSVASSGNPVTVTYTGPYNGAGTLYAHTGSPSGPIVGIETINKCPFLISGPSEVCYSGSYYSLLNPPPETIYWSVDDPTNFTVNSSGNPTVVVRTGSSNSNTKLRARAGSPSGLIMTDLVIYPCPVSEIIGLGNICNSGSTVFSINTGQYATWSVTSGFSLSTNYGVSTTVSATTPNQYGTLTAVIGSTTYTKSIQSLAPPGCYFPKTDYIYMSGLPGGASVQLNPYPSDTDPYAIYKWDVLFEANVWYDIQSGSDGHSLNVVYDLTLPSSLRVDAYQYIAPYGYSPLPTVEYRTATINYRSLGINVYPNPVAAVLNIEISDEAIAKAKAFVPTTAKGKSQDLTFDIRLFDVLGNMVRQQSSKGGTVQLNVTNLPNGVYFLSVYDGVSEKPEMKRVIVNH